MAQDSNRSQGGADGVAHGQVRTQCGPNATQKKMRHKKKHVQKTQVQFTGQKNPKMAKKVMMIVNLILFFIH